MTDPTEMLLGSAATLAIAGIVQLFRDQKKSATRFALGTAIVLAVALLLQLTNRTNP